MEDALKHMLTALSKEVTPLRKRDWTTEPVPELLGDNGLAVQIPEYGLKRAASEISFNEKLKPTLAAPLKGFRPTLTPKDRMLSCLEESEVASNSKSSTALVNLLVNDDFNVLVH